MNFFILTPSIDYSGPVKGAIALANEISKFHKVTIVSFKKQEYLPKLSRDIDLVHLPLNKIGLRGVINEYKKLLRNSSKKEECISYSFAFSSDAVNLFCKNESIIYTSVRQNHFANYSYDYGKIFGYILARLHLLTYKFFDVVIVMSSHMKLEVEKYVNKDIKIIGNFIDEEPLKKYRKDQIVSDSIKLIFIGSLTKRKNLISLINALHKLKDQINFKLEVVGHGEQSNSLKKIVSSLGLNQIIEFHGHLDNPYSLLANSNILVLPSFSEGIPRVALEALYLGKPCILRNNGGNSELILSGINGDLFSNQEELEKILLNAKALINDNYQNLLPKGFVQNEEVRKLNTIIWEFVKK